MNKQLFRIFFGVLCFVWIGIKLYDLITPSAVMSNTEKTFTIIGIFAFSIIGADNLWRYWQQRKKEAGSK